RPRPAYRTALQAMEQPFPQWPVSFFGLVLELEQSRSHYSFPNFGITHPITQKPHCVRALDRKPIMLAMQFYHSDCVGTNEIAEYLESRGKGQTAKAVEVHFPISVPRARYIRFSLLTHSDDCYKPFKQWSRDRGLQPAVG